MTSTTPTSTSAHRRTRSKSPRSRPTTPLRPSSRSSFRESASRARGPYADDTTPLELLEGQFAELSDAMADLENNFQHLQLMHESLSRFSESFAGFLYGMNMNAFCVDFPETPVPESFKRELNNPNFGGSVGGGGGGMARGQDANVPDVEATFLTTDTSFVENPPSSKKEDRFKTPAKTPTRKSPAPATRMGRGRGGIPAPRAGRGGGIPVRGGSTRGTRGSGIARGSTRGRGRGV